MLAAAPATHAATSGRTGATLQINSRIPPHAVRSLAAVEAKAAVRDTAGRRWAPDLFATGGSIFTTRTAIENTASPALYRSARVGIRSLTVPLRVNGNYLVTLYFAEIRRAAPGTRIFTVLAQGRPVGTVDVAQDMGPYVPYHLAFTAPVSRHRLTLRFRAIRGRPMLSAIQVTPVPAGITLPANRLVWDDEFTGPAGASPNPANWTYDLGPGWNQMADYTDSPENASLDGLGHLVIQARNDGPVNPAANLNGITSVRMTTSGRFSMLYGTAEASIQVSGQPGVVSTFWALGSDIPQVNWPRAGEIDPSEVRGSRSSVLVQALHMPCATGDCPAVWDTQAQTSLANGFHTYAVQRAPGVVIFLLDGHETASLTTADVPPGSWVFNRPFYLILNMIVGGDWAGSPPTTTAWRATMLVDWVRVYGG